MAVRLDEVTEWLDIVIPGSTPAVALSRIHAGPDAASLSLVRFPPGWSRPVAGHYTAAEEFVVLEGSIDVGQRAEAGDYVYLPPRTVRAPSHSESGALVLAWFSGAPAWHDGPAQEPVVGEVVRSRGSGTLRGSSGEVAGGYVVGPVPAQVGGRGADVLDPASRTWEWVEAGAAPTLVADLVHVRTWG